MKKYILGLAVTVVFIAYSIVLRHQHSGPVIIPAALSNNNASTPKTSTPSTSPTGASPPSTASGSQYKDGTYTGSVANAFYGNVQVSTTIQNGKIVTVNFLQYPSDNPNSIYVNTTAMPYLKQEAVQSQSANVSIITGATLTSNAFIQSLTNALSKASVS